MGDDFTGAQDLIPQTLDEQTVLSYTSDVPPSLLKEGLLTGTPAEVIDQAAEWRDHGLRYAVMCQCQCAAAKPAPRFGRQRALREDSSWTSQAINEGTKESVAASSTMSPVTLGVWVPDDLAPVPGWV